MFGDADDDEVAEAWRPLGYNIRPRRLQSIAREAVARFGGRLPSDEATLRSFKGIGPYTAGAVMSFAFRKRARQALGPMGVAVVLGAFFVVFQGREWAALLAEGLGSHGIVEHIDARVVDRAADR